MLNTKKNKSFTLVELLIVMIIIGMLATMGTFSYNNIMQKARNEQRKSDLKKIQAALLQYYSTNGSYPISNKNATATVGWNGAQGCGNAGAYSVLPTYEDNFIPELVPNYMNKLPLDPRHLKVNLSSSNAGCQSIAGNNCYLYISDGKKYKVISYCSPEGTWTVNDAYYDPSRPTWAFTVYSGPEVHPGW